MSKFKVGDKVRLVKDMYYTFDRRGPRNRRTQLGEVLTISEVVKSPNRDNKYVYGFREDYTASYPHWIRVEECFELAIPDWKRRLE